ncbi:MAG: Uma2 family endonuclease [Planctomycetota bacterium]|nr:MAG: Uma2 family endonuclease [Planctomycetota bacterium]
MRSVANKTIEEPRSHRGTPVWELARLYPSQGHWSEEAYLDLHSNQLIEFTHGVLEFLEIPTLKHQLIVAFLYERLQAHVRRDKLGKVLFAPLRIRVAPETIREPDVVYLSHKKVPRNKSKPPEGADLVMEVVSPSEASRKRDLIEKRRDYAQAGIAEYWIVDPESSTITVLALNGSKYEQAGKYKSGQKATSRRLPGFEIDVTEALTAD